MDQGPQRQRRPMTVTSFATRSGLVLLLLLMMYVWNDSNNRNSDAIGSDTKRKRSSVNKDVLSMLRNADDDMLAGLDDKLLEEYEAKIEQMGEEETLEDDYGRDDDNEDDNTDAKDDFSNRNDPIPESWWPMIDNLTCVPGGEPEYPETQSSYLWRAPRALLIGAMKAGTTALSDYIHQHPEVIRHKRKEIHFYDFKFKQCTKKHGILRKCGRIRYNQVFTKTARLYPLLKSGANPNLSIVDDSPRYLFLSDIVPARVLCVTPWAKIIAILRNPIDRAYSQYTMKEYGDRDENVAVTFEKWIQRDMDDLRSTGVVQDKIPLADFAGSEEELMAWKRYTRLGTHAPIGRGLYALQLRHWFKAYEEHGLKRKDSFHIIQSEYMRENTDEVYDDVVNFLGLHKSRLRDDEEKYVGHYHDPIQNATRDMLDDFYRPYNKELYDLLGDDWQGVWDSQ